MLFVVYAAVTVALRPVCVRQYWTPSSEAVALRDVARQIPRDAPVAAYQARYEYLYFKMDRPVVFAQNAEELRAFLAAPGRRYVVVKAKHARDVTRAASRPLRTIGSWRLRRSTVVLLCAEPFQEAGRGRPGGPVRVSVARASAAIPPRVLAAARRAARSHRAERSHAWSRSACR